MPARFKFHHAILRTESSHFLPLITKRDLSHCSHFHGTLGRRKAIPEAHSGCTWFLRKAARGLCVTVVQRYISCASIFKKRARHGDSRMFRVAIKRRSTWIGQESIQNWCHRMFRESRSQEPIWTLPGSC